MINKTGKGVESMTTVKRFFYGSAATLLALPVVVSAQFDAAITDTGLPEGATGGGIVGLITNIMQWMLALVGILAIIAFVISGIMYLTSMGDEERAKSAKNAMIYAVLGVVVALLGLIVLTAVDRMLKGEDTF
jgi:heme/copper-type cytochrome/quinol oxidase subunit 2